MRTHGGEGRGVGSGAANLVEVGEGLEGKERRGPGECWGEGQEETGWKGRRTIESILVLRG